MKQNTAKQPAPGMAQIEILTQRYASAHSCLEQRVGALNEEIEQVRKKHLAGIKDDVARAKSRKAELKAAIEAAPELFVRPRTVIFHGVKVGFRKGAGKVTFADADQVVRLIWLHFDPDRAETLIKFTEKPNKEAIAELGVAELKKIGCAVEGTGDVVEIRDTASDVDKLVAALLKDDAEEDA